MEHFSVLDEQNSVCRTRCLHTVRHHQDGLSLLIDLLKQAKQFICSPRIQRSCRLICKDQLGLRDQRSCHCRPLFLTAGYFIWKLLQKLSDSKLLCNWFEFLTHLRILFAGKYHRKIDIVLQRKCIQKIEILKYKSQILPAKCCHFFIADLSQISSFQVHLPGCWFIQRCQNI